MENEKPIDKISEGQVEKLASIGATEQEICNYLGIKREELMEQFDAVIRRHRALFQLTLRQKQFNMAINNQGNLRMLQWLGKFNLSQSEAAQAKTTEMPVKGYIRIDPEAV